MEYVLAVSVGNSIIESVKKYAAPLSTDLGLELVEVEYRREGHGWVLRIYIDSEVGVSLDDCAAVSRAVGAYLDAEDLIEHEYHLEVSSPGAERPLTKEDDYRRFAGRKVRIKMRDPLEDRRVFTGILEGLEGESVILLVDNQPVKLDLAGIAKARLAL